MKNVNRVSPEDFDFFASLIKEKSGIYLPKNEKNELLVNQRLMKLMERYALSGVDQLKTGLKKVGNQDLMTDFVSVLTTNKTEFFRESMHFDFLKQELQKNARSYPKLRIWSAAASTGQEAYSIAMLLIEMGLGATDFKILGTDINLDVLKKAKRGLYSRSELYGLSQERLQRFFDQKHDEFSIKNEVKQHIQFAPFNLSMNDYPFREGFDFVFCRNVLIYFDEKMIKEVLQSLRNCLKPNGHLIVGISESVVVQEKNLESLGSSVFKKVAA